MKFKNYLIISSIVCSSVLAFADSKDLEARVAELEANQSLNIFRFSGSFETRYDGINAKQTTPNVSGTSAAFYNTAMDDHADLFRMRFSLNADAKVNSYINFYSRFTTSKFFNNSRNDQNVIAITSSTPRSNPDFRDPRSETGSQVYLEKAYADIKLGGSGTVLSLGRLPTIDGPPAHLQTGQGRSGTYPSLIYNSILDGVALSYNKNLENKSSFAARLIYSPLTNVYMDYPYRNVRTDANSNYYKFNTNTDLASLMLEYSADMGQAGNMTAIYQGYKTSKIGFSLSSGVLLSDFMANSLTLEFDKIAGTGLNFAATYLSSQITNKGSTYGGYIVGYGSDVAEDTVRGSTTLAALSYNFSGGYTLGGEYLSESKGAFVYDTCSDNLTEFYMTPGSAYSVYALYKFAPELSLKVGYARQDYKYTPMSMGAQSDTDRKVDTFYTSLRTDF